MKLYAIICREDGPSTLGPFTNETEREAGVRADVKEQSAEPEDELLFADMKDAFTMYTYRMDLSDYVDEDDEEENEDEA